MPQMNKPAVNIGSANYNPIAALSKGLDKGAKNVSAAGASRFQVRAAVHMQAQQHEHEKVLQAGQHEHERGLALIHGAVDLERAKIEGRAQVHVARAHGASQVDIAKVQADSALKQQAATHRHELRLGIQQHNQDLQKQAQTHHEAVHATVVNSLLKRQEQDQADQHAANAASRATSFLDVVKAHAEPGTKVDISHGDARASFTARKETPAAPAAAPVAQETPKAETPKEEVAAPDAKEQRFAYNAPGTGKLTYGTKEEKEKALGSKPVKSKKAALKKKK